MFLLGLVFLIEKNNIVDLACQTNTKMYFVRQAFFISAQRNKQIHTRLAALEANGHPTDKIEIIIMGGTWSYLPKNYQLNYIIKCFKACNEFAYPPLSQRGVRGDFSKHLLSTTPITLLLRANIANSAIIREVHTYGPALQIGEKNKKASQHIGFGKKLINEAEKIARKNGYKKMAVISGVGVRDYYRKLGYKLEDTYMVKNI